MHSRRTAPAGRAESITVNACGLVQGIALVTFPAASTIFTAPTDSEPLALMRNHVSVHLLRLSVADLEAQGLYNLLRANGVTMRIAKQAIGARAATAAEARALGERRGAPLLTMERSAYDDQGARWNTVSTCTALRATALISP